MKMIEVKDLGKAYQTGEVVTHALRSVSFKIDPGEFVAIMGPSGSGKSTLMHIMSFLDRPTKGIYLFKGNSIDELTDFELARIRNKRMGFVFQTFNLLSKTSVFENVRLPLIYSSINPRKQEKMVREAVDAVGLTPRIKHRPNQLSGGEKQRVAIARALVNNPHVIFADEPTGNLDSKTGNQIMQILQVLHEKGHTIVLVTHEKHTSKHAERIIYLKDGKIESDREVAERLFAKKSNELLK